MKKSIKENKKRKKRFNTRFYHLCQPCAFEMGATWPEWQTAITCTSGRCPYCKIEGTLIPWIDFNWPTHKAVWD